VLSGVFTGSRQTYANNNLKTEENPLCAALSDMSAHVKPRR